MCEPVLTHEPGRFESPWKYSIVRAYVWLALLGSNEPMEVSSALYLYSLISSE